MKLTEANREHIDIILLSNAPLRELAAFFPNRESLLAYHAQRMAQIFPTGRTVSECECCNQHATESLVSFQWRGIYHTAGTVVGTIIGILLAMGGHGILPHQCIEFTTAHGFCKSCIRRIQIRKVVAELLEKLCFVVLLLSAMWFGGFLVFGAVILASKPNSREIRQSIFYPCFGFIGLVVGFMGAEKARIWCIPSPLRFIAKRPFQMVGVKKV